MNRITLDDLSALVRVLNAVTGNNQEPYGKDDGGKFKAHVGTYLIEHAYGGCQLAQIVSSGGGARNPLNMGFVSKRECHRMVGSFLSGVIAGSRPSSD